MQALSLLFQIKNQRKKLLPQVVISETSLEKAAFTYLCDAFEMLNQDTNREILRFSRKLAPYKVAFAATGSLADTIQNLKDLSMLLARKIRKCGISVLLLPDMCTLSVERQILRNDALGIPYTVLLNETTLKDGIISIRSRDTTLKVFSGNIKLYRINYLHLCSFSKYFYFYRNNHM